MSCCHRNDFGRHFPKCPGMHSTGQLCRLRLHVSRYPDIWISGCQRSGFLRSVHTCRIEAFSAFTRLQISGCIIRGILALCRRNTQMLFFGQVACLQTLFHFFLSFLLMFVGWTTRSKFCLVSSVIDDSVRWH